MLTSGTGISPDQFWIESKCEKCGERIPRGEPRRIVAFLSLAYGPGSQEYEDAQRFKDVIDDDGGDTGLEGQRTITFCIPCSGEGPEIPNPWHEEREERVADDPGGSVRAIPVGRMRIRLNDEIFADHNVGDVGKNGSEAEAATNTEAQDTILSGFAPVRKIRVASARRTRSEMTENDYRDRMARFLRANPSAMHGRMLQVCTLWAQGKKQAEIERENRIDQSTICRLVRRGKAMLG